MKPRGLKREVLPILEAGIEAARRLGKKNIAALWDKTGTAAAWDPKVQAEALALHAHGKLFDGQRKEDVPMGQEGVPSDLETDETVCALPPEAPPNPVYKQKTPQILYVASVRGTIKAANSLKTLTEADKVAK